MTDENRAAGQGEEGAGGLVLPKAVHGPNWAVSTEDDSASPSPQRAFGPIREAVKYLQSIFGDRNDKDPVIIEFLATEFSPNESFTKWAAQKALAALLGEAPAKPEQSPELTDEQKVYIRRCENMRNTHNDPPPFPPPGATVQPQARPMTWTMDVPKVPGPYWCRGNYGPTPGEKFVVRIQAHPDGAITMSDCRGRTNVIHERDRNREFAGPIPEPIEPPHQGEAT